MNQILSPQFGAWLLENGVGILILAAVAGIIVLILDRSCEAAENLVELSRIRVELEGADEHAANPGEVSVGDAADLYGRVK